MESLRFLLDKIDLRIISYQKRGLGKQYSIDYILDHLSENQVARSFGRNLLKRLGIVDRSIYLNLYEYINLIAIKNKSR